MTVAPVQALARSGLCICVSLTESHGFDTSGAHSMDVPACTIQYLCTCSNPLDYTGSMIVAEEFVKTHHLL
jgi:hypothetical protein